MFMNEKQIVPQSFRNLPIAHIWKNIFQVFIDGYYKTVPLYLKVNTQDK